MNIGCLYIWVRYFRVVFFSPKTSFLLWTQLTAYKLYLHSLIISNPIIVFNIDQISYRYLSKSMFWTRLLSLLVASLSHICILTNWDGQQQTDSKCLSRAGEQLITNIWQQTLLTYSIFSHFACLIPWFIKTLNL